jgi:hypothetical protein
VRGRIRLVTLTAATIFAVVGCIPARPSPSARAAPPSSAPSIEPAPTVASPPPASSAGTTTPAPASTQPSAGVAVDPSLLGVLPDAVEGVPLQADQATAEEIAREPSIAPFVSSLAIAAAFGPPASGSLDDYVVVTVAKVKPGLFGDLFFRGWRDTFDTAVCQQAGGVQGTAEATIGGRKTFIGTCAGGIHTYHVHVPQGDLIVSMQGGGPKRFGERVVEGLNE